MKEKQVVYSENFKASLEGENFSIPGSHLRLLRQGHMDIDGKGTLRGL